MSKSGKRLGFLPNWRIFSYVIVIFNIVMIAWVIAAVASNTTATDCGALDQQTCQDAANVGTAIGVGIIIVMWAVIDVILGILWLVTNRKKTRDCPRCGSDVKKGLTICRTCGYDFAAAVAAAPDNPTVS